MEREKAEAAPPEGESGGQFSEFDPSLNKPNLKVINS
jgi:hypothetical protein